MRERWPDRTFPTDLPAGRLPYLIERLRGLPARVEEVVRGATPEVLRRRVDGKWSAQTNVGHLVDLDELHLGRLDDLAARVPALRAADLANARTTNAGHDERTLADVLAALREIRARYVARLERLTPEQCATRALHPRLKVAMSATDLAFFAGEHDDYHLVRVRELLAVR